MQNILKENIGSAKDAFSSAIIYFQKIKKEENKKKINTRLIQHFQQMLKAKRFDIFNGFIDILVRNKMNDERELLDTLIIANNYFLNNKDAEILDRLNPEVRDIVEEIIKSTEEDKAKE
jgi:hypothetical protein